MSESEECPDLEKIVTGGPNSWCYFNQPINQIEGFDAEKPQILTHGAKFGLTWITPECVSLVKCIKIVDNEIQIEREKVVLLKNLGADTDTESCENIKLDTMPVVECIKLKSVDVSEGAPSGTTDNYEIEIQRKDILILGSGTPVTSEECSSIPLTTKSMVECVRIDEEGKQIKIEKRKLVIFKDLDPDAQTPGSEDCPNIELASCDDPSYSSGG